MTTKATPTMRVDEITIGSRHRRDLGDISALAREIEAVGLLHPIAVTPAGKLISGFRRLNAWKQSKFKDQPIPVHVVDLASIVRGEFSENGFRKNFTPTEMVAILHTLEPEFRAEAKKRQLGGRKLGEGGRAFDFIAKLLGTSRVTLVKAKAVVLASERAPDDDELRKIVEMMDDDGKVDGAFKLTQAHLGVTAIKGGRSSSERKQLSRFDALCAMNVSAAKAHLRRCKADVAFLEYVLKLAAKPSDDFEPLSHLLKRDQIEEGKRTALASNRELSPRIKRQ